jgi:predicted transcriptional regulator
MKRKHDRTVESSSQADVLALMEMYPNTWFTTEQIRKELNLKTREKIAKFLRKLKTSNFVEKKRVSGTNELLYKFKEPKYGPTN